MKHQQVVPDYVEMVKTSGTCLCLVFSGWVLFKLIQAIFWLPGFLEKNQGRLYEQLEQRSGITSAEGQEGDLSGRSAEKKDEKNQSTVDEDRDVVEHKLVDPAEEEKGENDAIECEADSKKDK